MHTERQRTSKFFETLVDGHMNFGGPRSRAQAIALLTRAREIEPWDDDLLFDLATLYAANDQADLALEMLSTLSCRVTGATLRRVRFLQLRLTLSFRFVYLWLRTFSERHDDSAHLQSSFEGEQSGLPDSPPLREVESRTG